MANQNTKEFTIKINGLEQSLKHTKSLGDAFLTVDKNILKVNTSIETLKKSLASIDKNIKIDISAVADMKKIEETMKQIIPSIQAEAARHMKHEEFQKIIPNIQKQAAKEAKENIKIEESSSPEKDKKNLFSKTWKSISKYFSKLVDTVKEDPKKVTKMVKELLPYLKKGKKVEEKKDTKAETDTKSNTNKENEKKKDEKINKNDASKQVEGKTEVEKEVKEAEEKDEKAVSKWEKRWKKIHETTKKYCEAISDVSTALFGTLNEAIAADKEKAEKELEEATEALNKVVEEKKKSTAKIDQLEAQAQDARGGRALVLQEQINNERDNNQKLAEQESQLAKKKEKAEKEKKKAESREKRLAAQKQIVEATMNIAQGVTKAWSFGPIVGPILAALVAIAGGVQIGIMTKKMSQLADGGLLKGKRHSEGGMRIEGTNIEVEGGEYVINRQSTDKNLGLIRYINSQRKEISQKDINSFFARTARGYEPPFRRAFAEGGLLPVTTETPSISNDQLVDAIRNIRFEPKVAVTDIIRVQESMVSVDNWVGI